MKKVISVVGARPNFMKIAPIHFQFLKRKDKIHHLICHTGQHYDEKMSTIFFDELGMPKPDFYLGVGSGSHAVQTAGIMIEFEKIVLSEKPDMVIVAGDVNSTIACGLVAKKLHIPIAHVEAGLRSFDMFMPEEINRILTDALSDLLFVSEKSGMVNLHKEGVSKEKIFLVGNTMIDSLVNNLHKIDQSQILKTFNIDASSYILLTLHRPANVDNPESLSKIVSTLNKYAEDHVIIFPLHPRTKSKMDMFGLSGTLSPNILLCEPLGYIDFLCLIKNSKLIITDSGGIQEEATYLGVQCLTLRENTERPITIEEGTNQLVGTKMEDLNIAVERVLSRDIKKGKIPEFWDGRTAERICDIIVEKLTGK